MAPASLTNRDIYLHVEALTRQHSGPHRRGLEDYLKVLWEIISKQQPQQPSAADLMRWMQEAFEAPLLEHDVPSPPPVPTQDQDLELGSYARFEHRLLQQIHELGLMRKNGQLADPHRYFGIDAPNGSRWYNFDPFTYLECGVRGSMGGFDEEDETLTFTDVEPFSSPIEELEHMSWALLEDLIICGACYE